MSKLIKAKYENGVIKPLEPLELREGEEVLVKVVKSKKKLEKYFGILGPVDRKLLEEALKETETI